MSRYIEEKDVIDGIRNNLDAGDYIYWCGGYVEDEVAEFPTADVAPVVHGEWIVIRNDGECDLWECSVCHERSCCNDNYCSHCGARMDGVL